MRAEITDYSQTEELLGRPYDPVRSFIEMVPKLIIRARTEGRHDAHSWRGLHVVGAGHAINTHTKQEIVVVRGNLKREPAAKVCMEKKVDGSLQKSATDTIGLIEAGPTDADLIEGITGLRTPLLGLCAECRHEIPESPIITPATIVVHTGLDSDVNQTFTIGQEVEMYAQAEQGDIDPKLFRTTPNFHDWSKRLATYDALAGGSEAACALPLMERQRLAQLALNREVSI